MTCSAGGTGALWREVERRTGRRFEIVGIDTRDMGPQTLKGDNRKFLQSLDLSRFDVVDLDAYGFPSHQLATVTRRGFRGLIFYTAIATAQGRIPNDVLAAYGITADMARTAPTLCSRHPDFLAPWWAYLASLGWTRTYTHTFTRTGSRGSYGAIHGTDHKDQK